MGQMFDEMRDFLPLMYKVLPLNQLTGEKDEARHAILLIRHRYETTKSIAKAFEIPEVRGCKF